MCGRFSYKDSSEIVENFQCEVGLLFDASYNACPQQQIPVIVSAQSKGDSFVLKLDLMKWGLIPEWAKIDEHKGFINARAETIFDKKSFKESFIFRRCIVPARGFFEWDRNKQPFFISNTTQDLAFAAIWDGSSSGLHPSVAILTRSAIRIKDLHDRCPLILSSKDTQSTWLDPTTRKEDLLALLEQEDDRQLNYYPVHKRVGNPRQNDKGLLDRMSPQ